MLAGNRNNNGNFNNLGNNTNFWSSTENNAANAYNLNLWNNDSNINVNNNNKENGFSVRCLEDSKQKILLLFLLTMESNLLEDLFTAYFDARKNKRNTMNALKFELNYESNLFRLYKDIVSKRYEISGSICFINFSPVQREIFAADFRDRIVHHLVFNYINPIFEKIFMNDSYSCRKNRGTHYGIKRIRKFISQCSANYSKDCYIMKLDIEGYFMNMDRELLYGKVIDGLKNNKEKIGCDFELLTFLLQKIIFNDPTTNCNVKGKKSDWLGLPESKSLFCADEGRGFPIGNLTSQLFGNIYLNSLDHYIKQELKIKYFGRYVDDFILIHTDKNYLLECRQKISEYLSKSLYLKLHPRKFYLQHFMKGVQFLGVYLKPFRVYIGIRTKTNFYKNLKYWHNLIECSKRMLPDGGTLLLRAQVNSSLGLMAHFNTFNLRRKFMDILKNSAFSPSFIINERCSKVMLQKLSYF